MTPPSSAPEPTLPARPALPALPVLPAAPAVRPLRELLGLAVPTIAQMSSYTLMQFADVWMLAMVGEAEATASGNAAGFAFTAIAFGMGVLFLVNTLASQAFGRGDRAACGRFLWQGAWLSAGYALALLPVLLLARPVFDAFGHEPRLAGLEASYFRIVVSAAVLKLLATSLGQFLLAIDRPRIVLLAAVLGVAWNTLGNYVLIFGVWGFPRMGLEGAAHATNMGTAVELLVLAWFAWRGPVRRQFGTGDWRPRRAELGQLLRLGAPSGVQVVAEVLAWSLFAAWVMASFATAGMAAYQFMLRYLITGFMPCLGISSAVTALVGRYVGMGRPDLAARRAHLGFALAAAYTACCGLTFFLFRRQLIGAFTDDPTVLAMGMALMTVGAFYSFFDAMYIVYYGALRGAADTFAPALMTAWLCWTVMLGGGWLVAHRMPELGVVGPWYAATAYGVLLGAYMVTRFQFGAWRRRAATGGGAGEAPAVPRDGTAPAALELG